MADQQIPSALAALQRYATFLNGSGPIDGRWFGDPHPELKGMFWWRVGFEKTVADVLAAWPTQAQEPVGWVIHDTAKWLPQGSYREAIIYSWQEADRIPVYTHPSPSTAALREALRDFLEANELGAHLLDTHPTVVRARTLLSRENTP